ncbi:MAG: hypothetical protein MUC82_07870 [Cypionkella sp.]|jgi:hypothetical protein|nr:hypothetical protein [Cypionkella sp.]
MTYAYHCAKTAPVPQTARSLRLDRWRSGLTGPVIFDDAAITDRAFGRHAPRRVIAGRLPDHAAPRKTHALPVATWITAICRRSAAISRVL